MIDQKAKQQTLCLPVVSLLLFVSVLVLIPSLTGTWLGDDHFLVIEAVCNHGIKHIPDILIQDAGRCNYRPLRHISYAVDFSVWGLEPFGYHLTNLLVHLGTLLAVVAMFRLLGLSAIFALFGAAVFALHPVQVDAVAYISGRRDVLMGLGYVLSVVGVVQFSRSTKANVSLVRSTKWAAVAVIGAIVSVTSKEMGVTIAATTLLFFVFGGYQGLRASEPPSQSLFERIWSSRWLWLTLAVPTLAMIVWRGFLNPESTVAGTLFGGSLTRHIATIFAVHTHYVELIFIPWRLAGDYAPPVIEIPTVLLSPMPILGMLWLSLLVALSVHFYRRGWLKASYGLSWYLLTMLPVSHIIPHHELAAEHYLYIPIVGLALCATSLLERAWIARLRGAPPLQRKLFATLLGVLLLALASRSFVRSFDYRSEKAHAAATIRHYPESVRGRARVGLVLLRDEDLASARPHLEYVLGTSFQGSARSDVLRELGEYFAVHGEYGRAIKLLSEYRSLRPRETAPLEALSKAYFETHRHHQAMIVNRALVRLAPHNPEYRYKLALTSWIVGNRDGARKHVRRALELNSDHLDALLLAATVALTEDFDKARRLLARAQHLIESNDGGSQERQRRLLRRLLEKLQYTGDELDP